MAPQSAAPTTWPAPTLPPRNPPAAPDEASPLLMDGCDAHEDLPGCPRLGGGRIESHESESDSDPHWRPDRASSVSSASSEAPRRGDRDDDDDDGGGAMMALAQGGSHPSSGEKGPGQEGRLPRPELRAGSRTESPTLGRRRIYTGGHAQDIDPLALRWKLRTLGEKFGPVDCVYIGGKGNRHMGFSFITFRETAHAEAMMDKLKNKGYTAQWARSPADPKEVGNREFWVNWKPPPPRPQSPRPPTLERARPLTLREHCEVLVKKARGRQIDNPSPAEYWRECITHSAQPDAEAIAIADAEIKDWAHWKGLEVNEIAFLLPPWSSLHAPRVGG